MQVEIHAVDPDVAGRYRAESANRSWTVDTDRLQPEFQSEGVVGRIYGIVGCMLCQRGTRLEGRGCCRNSQKKLLTPRRPHLKTISRVSSMPRTFLISFRCTLAWF